MVSSRPQPGTTLSVIVPFFDAPEKLERCLAALAGSSTDFELILVDDCSSDPRALEIAAGAPGRCVRMPRNSGPAAARNAGARVAQGDVLAFIDSDVVVAPDTLARLRGAFEAEPSIGACFGSYDDQPDSPGLITEYRNLLHHYTHQTGPRDATTFWAGCGAIRRDVFEEIGRLRRGLPASPRSRTSSWACASTPPGTRSAWRPRSSASTSSAGGWAR